MRQGDLIVWYVEQQNAMGVYSSVEEVKREVECIKAIIEVRIRPQLTQSFIPGRPCLSSTLTY